MRMNFKVLTGILILLLAACTTPEVDTLTAERIDLYATPAAQPWYSEIYACAPPGVVLRVAASPSEAQLVVRLGAPAAFAGHAYQIGVEQVQVVTHRQSPLQNMDASGVRELFAGLGDPSLEIWIYAAGEDVQQLFSQQVMEGRPVTTLARLAVSPQHMSDAILSSPAAVGILPRRWKAGDSRVLYTLPDVAVLALVQEAPQGGMRTMLACLQE